MGRDLDATEVAQSQEHGGDSRKRVVTPGELDRAVEGPETLSRIGICSFGDPPADGRLGKERGEEGGQRRGEGGGGERGEERRGEVEEKERRRGEERGGEERRGEA
ncbi:hypothetical protein D4764_21G0004420 [Takifugu flavidus]|uniref:Uncharacterized protein n=1 Tax=Takifugu flavidus TaxID=433684 RepID=A0A5C6NDE9_9TELE|nr:hypothetical protein D4764_21G0004420 [Takifugu flavidus]